MVLNTYKLVQIGWNSQNFMSVLIGKWTKYSNLKRCIKSLSELIKSMNISDSFGNKRMVFIILCMK